MRSYLNWTRFVALCLILFCQFQVVQAEEFLEPEQAFSVKAKMSAPQVVEVQFMIAEGYYLYKDRLKFTAVGAELGRPEIPEGKVHFDDGLQKNVETYRRGFVVRIPVKSTKAFVLKVTRQGCADKGLCFPPLTSSLLINK